MSVPNDISFIDYLRLSKRPQKHSLIIEEYDDFILKAWALFDLRSAAEDSFRRNRHSAYNSKLALPLGWHDIKCRLSSSGPPTDVISQISKRRYSDVDHLIRNLRKVLMRVRQKEAIGRVQQIDSHCLRWLTRQPGRSPVEKAGVRQEILAVTRVENYNTLENRVLKDFLLRAVASTTLYLRKYAKKYGDHELIRSVRRFGNLCREGLSLSVMDSVRALHEFPQPNYVLQQDSRYSKIWHDYCVLIRQEEIVQRLWSNKKEECLGSYDKCVSGLDLHCSERAKYHAPIWFNDLDGRRDILDSPWWENELGDVDIVEPSPFLDKVVVVDLTLPWDGRDELVYGCHHNAKPFIQNPHRPNPEPSDDVLTLREVIRRGIVHGKIKYLCDYFEQLHGLLGGEEWVILVPDDWDPKWLEQVKRAAPLPRHKVFLLWRSIAAVLGLGEELKKYKTGDSLVVVDGMQVPDYVATMIIFKKGGKSKDVLPQRASFRLHKEDRFATGSFSESEKISAFAEKSKDVICIGLLNRRNFPLDSSVRYKSSEFLKKGVAKYLADKNKGRISYYDELDSFTLIRTTRSEKVEKAELIVHDECWPGGTAFKTEDPIFAGRLDVGESKMSLYMYLGVPEDTDSLKLYEQEFEERMTSKQELNFDAEMTPGQGLATITLHAEFLEEDIELALHDEEKMHDSDMTVLRIERELKRHFPPNMPYVEACDEIWNAIWPSLNAYARTGSLEDNGIFAKAQNYYGAVVPTARASSGLRRYGKERTFDPETMSPVDRLKRENVFGNSPDNRLPHAPIDFTRLFSWLARQYEANQSVLRLIAWTYQYDNEVFETIRNDLFNDYTRNNQPLDAVKTSFCCNNFKPGDKRIGKILKKALSHIALGVHTENELRLVYNLLQFHPDSVKDCESPLCENAFNSLVNGFNSYGFYSYWYVERKYVWGGIQATKAAGYFIKCMLFLLHRRRFDDQFLQEPEGWRRIEERNPFGGSITKMVPPGLLGEQLPVDDRYSDVLGEYVERYNSRTLEGHESMRRSFIEYVNGRGTLEGIPNS